MVNVSLTLDEASVLPELEVKDATTGLQVLDLEPHERPGDTRGEFAILAGHTYVLKIKGPGELITVDFSINLQLS